MDVWRHIILENCSRLGWAEIIFKGNEQERVQAGCYQTWFSGVILPDDNYYSCDYGEDHGMKPLGAAERFLIDDLHNCEANRTLRESFRTGNLCRTCKTCPLTANKSKYNIKAPKA